MRRSPSSSQAFARSPDLVAHPRVRALLVRAQVEEHLRDVAAELSHGTRGHARRRSGCTAARRRSRTPRHPCQPRGLCHEPGSRRRRPAGSATSGSSRIAGAWFPRYRTRSDFASASWSGVTEPGPSGASVITAFMPLRWSAATISILPAGVEIAAMPRRSSVVSSFMRGLLHRWSSDVARGRCLRHRGVIA